MNADTVTAVIVGLTVVVCALGVIFAAWTIIGTRRERRRIEHPNT